MLFCLARVKDCLNVGGGGVVPGLTARKLGMTPRIRLGCCLDGSVAGCSTDWRGASGRLEAEPGPAGLVESPEAG
jgi:hypothetical protein